MKNPIETVRTYFRTRRHAKELAKIQSNLLDNPQILLETQDKFEKQFGKDQNRTRVQWRNLVRVYGMETVCKMERMTEKEVQRRCDETFSQKTLRELNESRAKASIN